MPPHIDEHARAVWADRADDHVVLPVEDIDASELLERLPVRSLGDGAFEVCCLSWWQYGFALGDTIRVTRDENGLGQVTDVISRRGRDTYRVLLHDPSAEAMQSVASSFASAGYLVEVYNHQMLSVDVADEAADGAFRLLLERGHPSSTWQWESARFAEDAMPE